MASVYSNPDYVAKLPKTGFPEMAQSLKFTSVPGQFIPTYCTFLQPGEKISGKTSELVRTNELESPAMTEIDNFVDYFFVPANKLYSIFGEWYFGIDDNPTALRPTLNAARVRYLPNITPQRIYSYFTHLLQDEGQRQQYLQANWKNFDRQSSKLVRLMAHFRFDTFTLFDAASNDNARSNLWNIPLLPFLAYQAIYFDYYRDTSWQDNDVLAYNIDDWLTTLTPDNITDERLTKIFTIRHRRQNSDYYVNVKPSPLQNATSMLNIDGVRESALLRVNQWLLPAGVDFSFISKEGANTDISLNNSISTDDISDSDLSIVGNGGSLGVVSNNGLVNTNRTATGTDSSNTQGLIHGAGTNFPYLFWDSQDNGRTILQGNLADTSVNSVDGSITGLSVSGFSQALSNLKSAITSSGIRTMFALEKLAKITARAGKHYDDQVLAHFGVKVPKGLSNEVYYLGGQHGQINIGEVISPSTTEGSVAGEMVGKGYGNLKDGKIEFTAPCHGFFMAIYSTAPRRTYTPVGSPKEFSQFERQDFPQPELINLGMQPLFPQEFQTLSSDPIQNLWQWRYSEFKIKVPMAIGGFSRFSETDQSLNGSHQDWTLQYPIYNRDNRNSALFSFNYENLLVNQSCLNSIFTLQWTPFDEFVADNYHVARLFDRDPLFHDLYSDFSKTSYMSTYGEPQID